MRTEASSPAATPWGSGGRPAAHRPASPATAAAATAAPATATSAQAVILAGALGDVLGAVGSCGLDLAGEPVVRSRPARPGVAVDWPQWVDGRVSAAFAAIGVARPWAHQAEAADHAWHGRHVVVATGPASGKTLAYQLPGLTAALTEGATTLYLSPTTALAADQADRVRRLAVPGVHAAHLDGDSPRDERAWVRDRAQLVHVTPDFVHHAVLPHHADWGRFLRRLRLVVVDECHTYRGVFGAHVAAILRRLLRAAAVRGADPVVVACSATAADPVPFTAKLTGVAAIGVDRDAAPHPGSALVIVRAGDRRSADAAALFAACVGRGVQTAAFTGSRAGAEAMARRARRELDTAGVSRPGRATGAAPDATGGESLVASYRGGHLAGERRGVEKALRDGTLRGVATTSALEVGVDVVGLDAVILDGWPGSVTSLQQRAGRAGRSGRPGVSVVLLGDDPVDAHIAADPDRALDRPVEAGVTDPDNPYVLTPHIAAAALESPITEADLVRFGPSAPRVVAALEARGDLRRRPGGWFWARREAPALPDIRAAAGGRAVTLLEAGTGRILGTVDQERACRTVHPGAVYLHRWDTYVAEDLDLEEGVALLRAEDPGWVTSARQRTDLDHVEVVAEKAVARGCLAYGTVTVTSTVTGYVRRDPGSGGILGEHPLELPPRTALTRAVWWRPGGPAATVGGLHAAEHVMVALLPLVVPCDRHDVAALTQGDGDTGVVTVWDSWPGGAGYAESAYDRWVEWTGAAAARLGECRCPAGCPSCVVQIGCAQANRRLDKAAARVLLGVT